MGRSRVKDPLTSLLARGVHAALVSCCIYYLHVLYAFHEDVFDIPNLSG